jgi:excisionase family DNA binding protein
MDPAPKVLYSRAEAARALALSLSTLNVMIGSGMLRAVHLGRRVLIHRDEIEKCGRRIAQQDSPSVWPEKLNGKTRNRAVA